MTILTFKINIWTILNWITKMLTLENQFYDNFDL